MFERLGRARFTPDSRLKLQSRLVAAGQLPARSWASFEDCTMPTTVNHNINIDDTVSNWLNWGNLVLAWAKGHQALPTKKSELEVQMHNGTQPAAYPLQSFYAVCFGGAAEVPLSLQEMLDMEARRVGEYVINECM